MSKQSKKVAEGFKHSRAKKRPNPRSHQSYPSARGKQVYKSSSKTHIEQYVKQLYKKNHEKDAEK